MKTAFPRTYYYTYYIILTFYANDEECTIIILVSRTIDLRATMKTSCGLADFGSKFAHQYELSPSSDSYHNAK